MYEVYSLSELAGTYSSSLFADIKKRRNLNANDDQTALAKHLHEKPILISSSSFDIVQSIEPFAKLTDFKRDWGTIVGISGLAMAKILNQENLDDDKIKQIVLNRLYVETPTSGIPTSPPADLFQRQGALWAFIHHIHAMGIVKAEKDGSEFPTLAESIPTRYKAVVVFLEGLKDKNGFESLEAFHAWEDILFFHGGEGSLQKDVGAVAKLLKTPKTLISTYVLQQVAKKELDEQSVQGILDAFSQFMIDQTGRLPTMQNALKVSR